MATLTHGSNAECPKVQSGDWDRCQGHEVPNEPSDFQRVLELLNRIERGYRTGSCCGGEHQYIQISDGLPTKRQGEEYLVTVSFVFDAQGEIKSIEVEPDWP